MLQQWAQKPCKDNVFSVNHFCRENEVILQSHRLMLILHDMTLDWQININYYRND